MGGVVSSVVNTVSSAFNTIGTAAGDVVSAAENVASDVLHSFGLNGSIGQTLQAAGNLVTNAVDSAAHDVVSTVQQIAANPLPVIETAALVVGLGPEGLGLSSSLAAPVASAAVTAANGGNVENIAKAAVSGYVGGQVSGETSGALSDTNSTLATVASSAAGADASATTKALLNGQNLESALQTGLKSAGSGAISSTVGETLSAAQEGISSALPDTSGTLASVLQPIKETVQPYVQAAQSYLPEITKQDIQQVLPSKSDLPQVPQSVLSTFQTAGDIAGNEITSAAKSGLESGLLGTGGTSTSPTTQTAGTSPVQTTAAPGSAALAQALRTGDISGTLFGDKEGKQGNVWNVESLRYMGDTGEA